MRFYRSITILILAVVCTAAVASAQAKRKTKVPPKKTVVAEPAPTPVATPADAVVEKVEPKKNERPAGSGEASKGTDGSTKPLSDPTYYYEFAQPDFVISKIVIEHDEAGRGTITFTKKLFGDTVSDPIQVSPDSLARINGAYAALNFVESTESYQYEKDYSHLGVMTFRLKKGDKQRTAVFNYTVNKDAKSLADEYRKLGNQFIWVFDITVARENQPLETPRLLDALDGLLKRNEISEPSQMVPILKGMQDDERIPLISRNHAGKLVERIAKGKK